MKTSKLLAQGSYGCVYFPGYSCSGETKQPTYVSKLSRDDKPSKVEYNMGKRVKKIPNYRKHFIIIDKQCKLKKKKIEDIKEGCEFINKRDYPSYVLLYSKYLESKELADVLANNVTDYYKLIQMADSLFNRVTELYSVGIIHMDLHFGNVLVSKKNERLYVIDFGLALDVNRFYKGGNINLAYLKDKWFGYKTDWPSWSLEYIFISLMVKENQALTNKNILSTITEYYNNNNVLSYYLDDSYIKNAYKFYKPFSNNSTEHNIRTLLQYTNTWDYYKLAYHFLSYMRRKTIIFDELKWLLLLFTHPNPEYRPTAVELKEHFHNYLECFNEYKSKKIYKEEGSAILKAELSNSIKDN